MNAPQHNKAPSGPRLLLWAMAFLVAALLLLPILYLFVRAAETDAGAWRLLMRQSTLLLLARSIGLAIAVTTLAAVIAVPLAWLTTRSDLPWRGLWGTLAPLPMVIPSYVSAYLFVASFGPRGLLQQLILPFTGLERLPSIYGFVGALIVLTLLTYPYIYLAVRGALQRLDPALEEASRSLGGSTRQTFWRITLPMLRPAISVGGLLAALYVLRDFGGVSIMRYSTLTSAIYVQYRSFDRSMAALYALLLIALTVTFLLIELRLQRRGIYHQGPQGTMRPAGVVALGRWRWVAFAACALLMFLALVAPTLTLIYWLMRGIAAGETILPLGTAAFNSVSVSLLAAGATMLAALPVALLVERSRSRLAALIERITWLANALPGIVVALALVFFGANVTPWLYQTMAMLVMAYVILFAPQGVGTVRSSLQQIHPSLEEAARGLGQHATGVLMGITLPLIRPGIWAGASMVFLTVMKELPATLILAPTGFRTLATAVWSSVSEAFFAAAAGPALLIVLLSSVPMTYMMLRNREP